MDLAAVICQGFEGYRLREAAGQELLWRAISFTCAMAMTC